MNTLYHGDCLQVLPELPAGSVDAIITDLPYGTTACEWDSIIPLVPMWEQVKRVLKPSGVFVTTAAQPFTTILISSNLQWFRYDWVWKKDSGSNFFNLKYQPFREHEQVLIFSENLVTFNPQRISRSDKSLIKDKVGSERIIKRVKTKGVYEKYGSEIQDRNPMSPDGMRHPGSVLNFRLEKASKRFSHPTAKPVALYEYLIRTYTNPGDLVLDFCMGSGTTIVAAEQTARNAIGIEQERKYYEIAVKRVAGAHPPLFTETATPSNNRMHLTAFGVESAEVIPLQSNLFAEVPAAKLGGK